MGDRWLAPSEARIRVIANERNLFGCFTGAVAFGGTAGVTGMSANFVNGVLSGVSVTPTVVGSNLTLTVNDGLGHAATATFNVQSAYLGWASSAGNGFENTFTDTALTSNPDADNLTNLQEFAFGMDPTSSTTRTLAFDLGGEVTQPGVPVLRFAETKYHAVFARRKDYVSAGLTYTAEFSADLKIWTPFDSGFGSVLTAVGSSDLEAVSIQFPNTVPVQSGGAVQVPKFFRVGVSGN